MASPKQTRKAFGPVRVNFIVAMALLLSPAQSRASDDVPRGPVEDAYAITIRMLAAKGKAPPPAWRPPHRDKLMSRSLSALLARDDLYQEESGEMARSAPIPSSAARTAM